MSFQKVPKFVVEELVIKDNGAVTFPDDTVQTTAYTGDLSPLSRYGQVSKMNNGTITIATQSTYQSTGLTATLDSIASGVALGTTNTFAIKNTSGETRIFDIYASMDADTGATTSVLGIGLAKNGTFVNSTECRAWAIANQSAKLVSSWMIELAPNDELALFVANFTGTGTVNFLRGRIVARTV
jgi:hypothetical protein